jgi:uncharacterized membrane protein (DUF4010 family)
MDDLENFRFMAIALAIGLLIGLERGWHSRNMGEGTRIAGLRTYGLIALLGGLWGIVAKQGESLLLSIIFLSLSLILILAFSKSLEKFEDYSITGMTAALMTFSLGVITVYGHINLAAASAVVVSSLLGFKPLLHGWISKIEERELHATLKLLLISVVILPVLPNKNYTVLTLLNPFQLWLMVVIIAGISFLGYFTIKIAGTQQGPVLTGLFGGLVSSTAVTLNLSKLAAQQQALTKPLAAGILTACATMFFRPLIITYLLNFQLFSVLLPPLFLMGLVTYVFAVLFWWQARALQTDSEIHLANPFQLGMAMKFGVLLFAIMLISKFMQTYFGNSGTYFLALASGIADIDPITITLTQMSRDGLPITVAERGILLAIVANTIIKSMIALYFGGRSLGLKVSFAVTIALGLGFIL